MILSNDIVTCFNDIISAQSHIQESWHNPVTNTYSPQVNRILLKSFKLFQQLDLTATDDVMNFYSHLQELLTSHLLVTMPFDGLGTQRYSDLSQTLMNFLPRLIPRSLSSCINATLIAVQNESNNGYNYLWRVLELAVPGFDPVISIQTPQWLDCNNIF
jgi:hypothetical protein